MTWAFEEYYTDDIIELWNRSNRVLIHDYDLHHVIPEIKPIQRLLNLSAAGGLTLTSLFLGKIVDVSPQALLNAAGHPETFKALLPEVMKTEPLDIEFNREGVSEYIASLVANGGLETTKTLLESGWIDLSSLEFIYLCGPKLIPAAARSGDIKSLDYVIGLVKAGFLKEIEDAPASEAIDWMKSGVDPGKELYRQLERKMERMLDSALYETTNTGDVAMAQVLIDKYGAAVDAFKLGCAEEKGHRDLAALFERNAGDFDAQYLAVMRPNEYAAKHPEQDPFLRKVPVLPLVHGPV